MPKKIPKYVQTLKQIIPSEDIKERLIKTYDLDGIIVDKDMLKANPNAKQSVISITNTPPKAKVYTSGSENFDGHKEVKADWIYGGLMWYVRKIGDEYQFARYMVYNTKTKKVEELWDEDTFKSKNK